MIDRTWRDGNGTTLLSLYRHTLQQVLFTKEESLPDIETVGTIEEVAGTGIKIYTGSDALKAGEYSVTLGTYGQTHGDAFSLQREILQAAVKTRSITRTDGGTLQIARFTRITRNFRGSPQSGGSVTATFQPAHPYWIMGEQTTTTGSGDNKVITVAGDMNAPLRLRITAGASPITNPYVVSDAGTTTFRGTVPAGQLLEIDMINRHGVFLNGYDARVQLNGPEPFLRPGNRTIQIVAPGATIFIDWLEGRL